MKVNPRLGEESWRREAILKVNDAVYFGKLISWSLKQHQECFLFKMADSESFFFTTSFRITGRKKMARDWLYVMS